MLGGSLLAFSWHNAIFTAVFLLLVLPFSSPFSPARLDYSIVEPAYEPFPGCATAISDVWNDDCALWHNTVDANQGTGFCSYEESSNTYAIDTPTFYFQLGSPRSATMSFWVYQCRDYPPTFIFRVNGRCQVFGENWRNGLTRLETVSIEAGCFNSGQNSIEVVGDGRLAIGNGACPSLTCLGAPLYARLSFPEVSTPSVANGTVLVGAESSPYSFQLTAPAGKRGTFPLPGLAFGVSCDNCSVSNGSVSFTGNQTLNYSVPNLEETVSFGNEGASYLPNESVVANVSVSFGGSPVSSDIYFLNGTLACNAVFGSCDVVFRDNSPGAHMVQLEAVESPSGKRGLALSEYFIEGEPKVSFSESVEEELVTVTYLIENPTHSPFAREIQHVLPEDFSGGASVDSTGFSVSQGVVSFNASCSGCSNCTYSIRFSVAGVKETVGEPAFPERKVFGEEEVGDGEEDYGGDDVIGTGTVFLENTNLVRAIRSKGSIPNGCSSGCSWDVILGPGEKTSLGYSVNAGKVASCGLEFFGSELGQGRAVACVSVPNGFPSGISLEYLVPFSSLPGYSGGAKARLGGLSVPVSVSNGKVAVSLGSLPSGKHYVELKYLVAEREESDALAVAERQDEPACGVGEQNGGSCDGASGKGEPPVVSISAPDACEVYELVQVVVTRGEEPAFGTIEFVSPSGRKFTFELDAGKKSNFMDEKGAWTVRYGETWKTILVLDSGSSRAPGPEVNGEMGLSNSIYRNLNPESAGFDGLSFGPFGLGWTEVLLIIALPFLAMPILGYFVLTMSRGPQVIVNREYDGKTVKIEVENRGGTVTDVWVTEALPEDAVLGDTCNGSFRKTIFGNVLKWRVPALGTGEKWSSSYCVRSSSGAFGGTRVSAKDSSGRTLNSSSG